MSVRKYDVLVCGGGPAGVSAAFAAARMGARTLIVEQFNCLGGVATAGGHNHIAMYTSWLTPSERVVGGITWELVERIVKSGYGRTDQLHSDFEIEGMKLLLEQMAEESRTELLYHSLVTDTIVQDGQVIGVTVHNKNGAQQILADRIIDCTGDGDIAARAGCGFDVGDEDNGFCQPVTLMFTIGGVDYSALEKFRGHDYKLSQVWKQAQDNGDMRPFQKCIMGWWWTPTRPDQLGINFTHVNFIDSTKAEDLTRATLEARKQAYESIAVFRKYVPGLENCYMVSTPNTIGIRESRRIHGLYTLTKEDLLTKKRFDDSIGYGSFFIDIHNVSGPGMDKKAHDPEKGFKYQIPYRILLPKDADNLLVAGRCASCCHEALGSLRQMAQCGVMGQAAGVAAVLSHRQGISPKQIDVTALQKTLKEQGCIL